MRILIAEDEPVFSTMLERTLIKWQYDVIKTCNGIDAWDVLQEQKEPPKIVLLDWEMPGMSGLEICQNIRENLTDTYIYILLLTGRSERADVIAGLNAGADDYITKPFEPQELKVRLDIGRRILTQEALLRDLNQNLELKVEERTSEVHKLHQDLKQTFLGSVQIMSSLAERHSPMVGNHSRRVAELCRKVGQHMGLSEEELIQVQLGAILHDIGKINLPASILAKEESYLTPQEVEQMKEHPLHGEAIVKMIPNLEEVARCIRHHHENYNGKGYPDQLKREQIPISSRIIAAVDAYDKALHMQESLDTINPERALSYIAARTASHFDPAVVTSLKYCVKQDCAEGLLEIEIFARDLRSGMVLARDVMSSEGFLLFPKGFVVQEEQLQHIHEFLSRNPVKTLCVYRKVQPLSPDETTKAQPESLDKPKEDGPFEQISLIPRKPRGD